MPVLDWAKLKQSARQVVHDYLSVFALYQDNTMSAPEQVTVRWHNTLRLTGDYGQDPNGLAQVIEGLDKLIFDLAEIAALALLSGPNLKRGGIVTLPPEYQNLQFELDVMDPPDGPVELVWNVTRKKT